MRYETIKHLKDSDFKRPTGVQRETFYQMLKVIEKGLRDFGRPTKLSRSGQLLMTLIYWREYPTMRLQRRLKPFKHKLLPNPLNRWNAYVQCPANLKITPTFIGFQQYPGMGQYLCFGGS